MQSWGGSSKFETRNTEPAPTKSAMVGFLAAALGRQRTDTITDLSALRFGVRIDRPGYIHQDFHTVNKNDVKYVTYRDYIEDGIFLAGFESDDIDFLKKIEYAIKHPVFPLFLGRKACPPTLPIVLGIRQETLQESLANEPCLSKEAEGKNLHILMDIGKNAPMNDKRSDFPISFDSRKRQHTGRGIHVCYTQGIVVEETIKEEQPKKKKPRTTTGHDAFNIMSEHDAFAVY